MDDGQCLAVVMVITGGPRLGFISFGVSRLLLGGGCGAGLVVTRGQTFHMLLIEDTQRRQGQPQLQIEKKTN